jgi:hypothetical protein
MKTSRVPHVGLKPVARGRLVEEKVHDAYKLRGKLPEPTVCPQCGAVFHKGRWQWLSKPPETCPACHRIRDHFPAGYVTMKGKLLKTHRDELVRLIRNQESREKTEHALERIMKIEEEEDSWLVTTTDIHLARRIGEALHRAHKGQLEYSYNDEENLLRVSWTC